MLVVVGMVTATVVEAALATGKLSSNRSKRGKLRGYAETGIADAFYQLWQQYLHYKAVPPAVVGTPGNYADFSGWLTSTATFPTTPATTGLAKNTSPPGCPIVPPLPVTAAAPWSSFTVIMNQTMADGTNVTVYAYRWDIAASSAVYVQCVAVATAKNDNPNATTGEQAAIGTIFEVGGKPYAGFGYGLLTSNVECMMCHVNFNNAALQFNKNPANYGTIPNVKVGITNQFVARSDATALLGGQIFTRGPVMDENGNSLTTLPSGITTLEMNNNLDIYQSSTGATTTLGGLTAAPGGSSPPPNYYFYENYPTDPSQQTAGQLPTSFPSPFNGSDYASWASSAATGTLSGGMINQFTGTTYGSTSLPTTGNTASVSGYTTGTTANFLVGTQANPIVINGTVGLSGDVVISGYIKGSGEIAAQGNLYVMGDLVYADGTDGSGNRTFGTAADGTTNAVAFTAGGNILVQNFVESGSGGTMGPSSGTLLNNEIGTYNRTQYQYTQPTLPNKSGTQIANSTYQPGYTPRYYTMNPGDPVYVEAPVSGQSTLTSSSIYWNSSQNVWAGSTGAPHTLADDNNLGTSPSGATVLSLVPSWISADNLNSMYHNQESARLTANGGAAKPFEVDGLLYSSNLIFALARNDGGIKSSGGNMNIYGSIVAADTGMLAGGSPGINLNFDARTAAYIHIVDTSQVTPYTLAYMER
jgi:hypothetical protein